jgi:hypothetical protein
MENLLDLYRLPYDPRVPLVCMDEACKQLIAEIKTPLPVCEGQPAIYDYEYERKGVCNLIVFVEPLRGWRKVFVRSRRTMLDWAECIRTILGDFYPDATLVRLVLDNLNTHTLASLYEAFAPAEARRLARRLELHFTPKHGSWLNMAETEIGILTGQCLDRRIDQPEVVCREVAAWENDRNDAKATINWRFTIADARVKLKNIYPSLKN